MLERRGQVAGQLLDVRGASVDLRRLEEELIIVRVLEQEHLVTSDRVGGKVPANRLHPRHIGEPAVGEPDEDLVDHLASGAEVGLGLQPLVVGPLAFLVDSPCPHPQGDDGGDHQSRRGRHRRDVAAYPTPCPTCQGLRIGRDRLVGRPTLDILGQRPATGVATIGPGRHGHEADGFEGRIDRRIEGARRAELATPDGPDDFADVALERGLPREQAVERGTERLYAFRKVHALCLRYSALQIVFSLSTS